MEDIEMEEDESEFLRQDFPEIFQSQEEEQTGDLAPSGVFCNEAEMALQEILAQLGFEDATLAATLAKFQQYVSMTLHELPMKQEQGSARQPSMIPL
jgi:hypothetical protein